jgi:hypothetical protein
MASQITVSLDLRLVCKHEHSLYLVVMVGEKTGELSFAPVNVANRWEKPLPNEPAPSSFETDLEKNPFQGVTPLAPAIVKGDIGSTPRHAKSMLQRLSGKPRRLAVTLVDAARSTVTDPPLPVSPAETLDDIVSSYSNTSSGSSTHTPHSGPRTDATQLASSIPPMSPMMSIMSPRRLFQTRITSRWSMSTAADDVTRASFPTTAAHYTVKNTVGLPSNPRSGN